HAVGLTNLTGHGGFLPNGIGGVMTGLLAVVFAFGGVELVTIAAAESANPREALRKTTRTVVARLLLFYIGSVALMVLLLPWDSASATTSPFVAVLDRIGIPAAAQLMNVVVLTSLLSALNSNLYGASRIGFSLAQRGEAPRGLLHVSAAGVPRRAVLASVAFGFVTVILNVFAPDHVLPFLLNTLGAMVLVIWMAIALSQIRLRHLANRTPGETPTVRMWGHPWLSWTAVAGMTGVLALMCTDDDARSQLISTATLTALIIVAAVIRNIVTKNESKA
ncbi:amino acid permease, partial [Streptomyces sp. NPDC005827]|uniref:amino acid permease n=1 Tax=Streptomyces sp. NPDC005827 TaxID=3157070 RepID=UPI0033EF603B